MIILFDFSQVSFILATYLINENLLHRLLLVLLFHLARTSFFLAVRMNLSVFGIATLVRLASLPSSMDFIHFVDECYIVILSVMQCITTAKLSSEIGCLISEGPWVFVGLQNAVKVWFLKYFRHYAIMIKLFSAQISHFVCSYAFF